MDLERLESRCRELFPENADRLFPAMQKIHNRDFCVTTGWTDHQISISRSCVYRGKLFNFSKDYGLLITLGGWSKRIDNIGYADLADYLPAVRGKELHCSVDKPVVR